MPRAELEFKTSTSHSRTAMRREIMFAQESGVLRSWVGRGQSGKWRGRNGPQHRPRGAAWWGASQAAQVTGRLSPQLCSPCSGRLCPGDPRPPPEARANPAISFQRPRFILPMRLSSSGVSYFTKASLFLGKPSRPVSFHPCACGPCLQQRPRQQGKTQGK